MTTQEKPEARTSYDFGDTCTHCGGKVEGGCFNGNRVVNWCNDCGGNNPSSPPNISITTT